MSPSLILRLSQVASPGEVPPLQSHRPSLGQELFKTFLTLVCSYLVLLHMTCPFLYGETLVQTVPTLFPVPTAGVFRLCLGAIRVFSPSWVLSLRSPTALFYINFTFCVMFLFLFKTEFSGSHSLKPQNNSGERLYSGANHAMPFTCTFPASPPGE